MESHTINWHDVNINIYTSMDALVPVYYANLCYS